MEIPFTLRVSVSSDQGGRKYMEDVNQILVEPEPGEGELPWEEEEEEAEHGEEAESPEQAPAQNGAKAGGKSGQCVGFFAVFDGHGGREAAHFARDHLWGFIRKQKGFMSQDPEEVCTAIRKGFIACHHAMWKKLRDLWSYDFYSGEFVVSPEPDTSVHTIDPQTHKYIIIGSDGLWNMVSAQDAILLCQEQEKSYANGECGQSFSKILVNRALAQWRHRMLRADNTSAIVICISPQSEKPRCCATEELFINLSDSTHYNSQDMHFMSTSPCSTPPIKMLDDDPWWRLSLSEALPTLVRRNAFSDSCNKWGSESGKSKALVPSSTLSIGDSGKLEDSSSNSQWASSSSGISPVCHYPGTSTVGDKGSKAPGSSNPKTNMEKLSLKRTLEESNSGPAVKKPRRTFTRSGGVTESTTVTPKRKSADRVIMRRSLRGQKKLGHPLLHHTRKSICVC
ncbi:hypothetical protein GDO81_005793 [Engystomops pustulosus]|uniref:PPM-type phosphatase domain-containing protein n=1 Tax=Engystomops pustulosus TaxID=76066 RepID=A0AAV7CSS7_ENGPU|nr:hypothetical protein GDO81_005793 [Engystomops pustulosus]